MKYRCLPYLMRYQNKNEKPWESSEFAKMYITMARWCNQPSIFKKKSFREFCHLTQLDIKPDGGPSVAMRVLHYMEEKYPDIAEKYFDMKFPDNYECKEIK